MKDKINILFIIDHFVFSGGTEGHLAQLIMRLDKNKYRTFIVGFDVKMCSLINDIELAGTTVKHIPVGRFYTWNALRKGVELYRLIRNLQIDIVQTFHFKSDFYGTLVARLSGVKKIISSKRDRGHSKKKVHFFLNRLVNPLVTGFIVVSSAVKEIIVEKEKAPSSKITTIYNGVDTTKYHPPSKEEYQESRKRMGLGSDDFVVGQVAVFRPEKGYDIFFNAIEIVHRLIPNLKAVVVGGGPLLNAFEEYVAGRPFAKLVKFVGPVEDVRESLNAMDIACLVSGSEGFSNAILEEMSSGLPLIVTDSGGSGEAVVDQHNGLVIPTRDSEALAKAILDLYYQPEKRKAMGAHSRKRVEERFSIQKMIERYEKYYEEIENK